MYYDDQGDYTQEQFDKIYDKIYEELTSGYYKQEHRVAYLLGGQPGSGKSTFYTDNNELMGYVVVDGDKFRKYHPNINDIIKNDYENYVERTQHFSNQVVERLIKDLSYHGYNIVIEGTLRDAKYPISTCKTLKEAGYVTNLVIVACDAELSWKSTINRTKILKELGEYPRLVPIDKFNRTIKNIPDSISEIEHAQCFSSIRIIDRDRNILYDNDNERSPSEIIKNILNIQKWNSNFQQHQNEYYALKMGLLKEAMNHNHAE